jgi:uncharacterized protein (TIGR02594 family)
MNIEAMQVPLIAFLATVFVMGLVQWYLIYARFSAPPAPPSVAPGPPVGRPTVPDSGEPAEPAEPVKPPAVVVPEKPPVLPDKPVIVPPVSAGSDFDRCVALVLEYEGGNDDDPRDPGGRTSRGILQSEWNIWCSSHPGLPADVWQAPQDQVLAIYRAQYWNALLCDSLPSGVDLAVFDYGVNSGTSRSAKLLQTLVGTDADGEVGPDTIAAAAKADPVSLVGRFCDARLSFLQGLPTWGTFGKGWTARVVDVRKEALALAAEAPRPKIAVTTDDGVPPWLAVMRKYSGTHEGNDNPVILGFAAAIGKTFPDMASYCARYTHDSIAWCGLTVAYCVAMAGIRPQFGATDEDRFLWADSWRQFGVAVSDPQLGDIICVKWSSGGHHVTLYESTSGSNYMCRGGNQSDAINVMPVPKSAVTAIRRPVLPATS